MSSVQTKANKNINRNEQGISTRRKKKSSRRRSEETALGVRSRRKRSSSGSSIDESLRTILSNSNSTEQESKTLPRKISTGSGDHNENLNSTKKSQERRISRRDIVALLDEQRSFREELEDINRTNFNLEHLLSNCALKVENFNRKLLLVEYELSDYHNVNIPSSSCPIEPEMKWNKEKEKVKEKEKEKEKVIPGEDMFTRNVPLRRSNIENKSPCDSPTFDNGRHKLEKYAKIHGIVDVEIEMYSSADDMETTSDNRETTDMEEEEELKESESENTFSYGDKQACGDTKSNGDVTKEIVRSTSKPFRFSTRDQLTEPAFKIDHNLPSDLLPADSRSKSDSKTEPVSPAVNVEYSLVDADHDIFSHSIHSNDTIEQIDIVFPAEETPLSSMAKTSSTVQNNDKNNNSLWPDIQTTLLGSDDGLGGSWVDDVLRLYDRESSRERESLSETALSNGFDYRMETMSSSSFFSEDDDRIAVKVNSTSSPDKPPPKTSNGYPPDSARDSADYSDWVFSPDFKMPSADKTDIKHESDPLLNTPESTRSSGGKRRSSTSSRRSSADNIRVSKSKSSSRRSSVDKKYSQSNSRRSSVDKKLSSSSSRRSSIDKKHSTPSSSRSSTPDSAISGRRSSTPDSRRSNRGCTPDVIPEEPAAEIPEEDFAKSLEDLVDDFALHVKTPKQDNIGKKQGGFFAEDEDFAKSLEDLVDAFTEDDELDEAETFVEADQFADGEETEEQKIRRKESEAVDRLLADLDITEEEIQRSYNTPAITIETGVEDGAPSLREHKSNEIEPDADVFSRAESPITERARSESVFGFEDSDEEERKKRWRERPFPKRAARSFFARLCACWHH